MPVASHLHLARVGALANVGRFLSIDAVRYPRGSRVVVRTQRGLEAAEVLSHAPAADAERADGLILRGMTVEDDLLDARLHKHRDRAWRACNDRLAERGLNVTLMDVEHLFDGQTLVFYFLGEPSRELDELTAELTELYEAKVEFRRFAETLVQGCGPGCGTADAPGGGCGTSCGTSCAVAGACGTRKT